MTLGSEGGLINEHDVLPVRLTPGPMLLIESHPLPNYLVREERLLGCAARGHPQPLLNNVLDGADRDVGPASHLILQLLCCF